MTRNVPKLLFVAVLFAFVPGGRNLPAEEKAGRTTVALTAVIDSTATAAQQDLAGSLLVLLEHEVLDLPTVAVVERREIDLLLDEQLLTHRMAADSRQRLQLRRLLSADLIATVKLLPVPPETKNRHALLRISESRTGAIRGVTVAPIEPALVADAASEFARYLDAIVREPKPRGVTVAVAPFDSVGRFDRLRSLETGVRDLITARFLSWNTRHRELAGSDPKQLDDSRVNFHVLQRDNLHDLLEELNLVRHGFAASTRSPEPLPTRAAAYLIDGRIDERHENGGRVVIVKGRLVNAASGIAMNEFEVAAAPEELPKALAQRADVIALQLLRASAGDDIEAMHPPALETELLWQRTLEDVLRFQRRSPIDFSFRRLSFPRGEPHRLPPVVDADSILGRHLLRKSIDRLESLLFIDPGRTDAALALAFCHSFHVDTFGQPERSARLLRTVRDADPSSAQAATALALLAELGFHHQTGRLVPPVAETAVDDVWDAYRLMPAAHRDVRWPRMLGLLGQICVARKDWPALARSMHAAARDAERADVPRRDELADQVSRLASLLATRAADQPNFQKGGTALLERWAQSNEAALVHRSSRALAGLAASKNDHAEAARWFAHGSEFKGDGIDPSVRANLLVHAGRHLRLAKQPQQALRVLESIGSDADPDSLNAGYRAVEMGKCYEELQQPDRALELYVRAAERSEALVINSDVAARIEALGGVPLREDRPFEVRYIPGPNKQAARVIDLTSDGERLYCAAGRGSRVPGVYAFHPDNDTWETLLTGVGAVTSVAFANNTVWAGTAEQGIWRYDVATGQWTQFSTTNGLPDDRTVALAAVDDGVYAGVGTPANGSLIRIDSRGEITIYESDDAPQEAPTHIVVQDDFMIVSTRAGAFRFSQDESKWKRLPIKEAPRVFAGKTGVWALQPGQEVFRLLAAPGENESFRVAWVPRGSPAIVSDVRFVTERDGQLWFGGASRRRFRSVGLYRFDPRSGEFITYGPRDGFRVSPTCETYDGLWIGDDLWLATSAGLAVVTPRMH